MDGNCWYDAAADQVVLYQIPDRPGDHHQLRLEVCRSLRHLPQTSTWVENFFRNSKKRFSKFIAAEQEFNTYTYGIKGNIDSTLVMKDKEGVDLVTALEIKTGKHHSVSYRG